MNGNIRIDAVVIGVVFSLLIYFISTVLHELSHWLVCKLLKCHLIGLKILLLYFDGKKWSFQLEGRNHCAFITNDITKAKKVAAAGPLIEIIVLACCIPIALATQQKWLRYGLIGGTIMIALSVIYNLLPVTNGDGRILSQGKNQEENGEKCTDT